MPPKNNIFSRIGNQIVVCCWLYTEVCSDKKWWRWGDLERMLCMWEKRRLVCKGCKAVGIGTTQLTGQHTPRYYHQRPPVCGPRRATNAAWWKRQVDSIYWDVTDCGIGKPNCSRKLLLHALCVNCEYRPVGNRLSYQIPRFVCHCPTVVGTHPSYNFSTYPWRFKSIYIKSIFQ